MTTDAPGETPASREAVPAIPVTPPEVMPGIARPDLQALAQEVYDTNTRETIELVQALKELREFLDRNYTEPKQGSRAILKQAIQDAMAVLSDVKGVERNPSSTKEDYERALTSLTALTADGQQNLMAILQNPRHGISGNNLVAKVDEAFNEKIRALDKIALNIRSGNFIPTQPTAAPVATPESGEAPGAPAAAPEAPATPEQTAFNVALEPDKAQSLLFKKFLVTIHTDFSAQLAALKEAAPIKAGSAADEGLATFSAEIVTIKSKLDEIDQLAAHGEGNDAKTKLDELKIYVEEKLTATIQTLEEKKNKKKVGIGLNESAKAIVDQAIQILTDAKGQLPALAESRTVSLTAVEEKHAVLVSAGQAIPPFVPSTSLKQQQEVVDQQLAVIQSEAPASGPESEKRTMEQFTDELQDAWEKMGEAMQGKKWGAVLGALLGMLGLIMARLKSMDSLDDWTSFFEGFGEEEAETPAGAPEKPADVSQVLAQFGIADEGEQGEFADLKATEVIRFVRNDGAAPANGEAAYSQTLVDFKANQAEAYGKLKAQLELNGFAAYHEALPEKDKLAKTLGDFINYRITSDATKQEGWKNA